MRNTLSEKDRLPQPLLTWRIPALIAITIALSSIASGTAVYFWQNKQLQIIQRASLLPSNNPLLITSPSALPSPSPQESPPQSNPSPPPSLSPQKNYPIAYTIVVINELGKENMLNGTYQRTLEMMEKYEPWKTYAPYVQVKKISNTKYDFDCEDYASYKPNNRRVGCYWEAVDKAIRQDMKIDAGTIIIAFGEGDRASADDNVASRLSVIATANGISAEIIAHELGHTLAGLEDEYIHAAGDLKYIEFNHGAANCFPTAEKCAEDIAPYTAKANPYAACFQGCGLADWWRPSYSGLMYNSRSASSYGYGPLEECQMAKQLEKRIATVDTNFQPNTAFCGR